MLDIIALVLVLVSLVALPSVSIGYLFGISCDPLLWLLVVAAFYLSRTYHSGAPAFVYLYACSLGVLYRCLWALSAGPLVVLKVALAVPAAVLVVLVVRGVYKVRQYVSMRKPKGA